MSGQQERKERMQSGQVRREDVIRRLAELAYGKANDCVRLVMEEKPRLGRLDLSLLREVRRNEKGMIEVKLIDRLQVLERLASMMEGQENSAEAFLLALKDGEGK